ncbi:hypothetical protein [Corynebacterium terpenotabidum]|uniref:Uncharacterized protein n=1 Tax=Corynebacterium terpenotabidum Y-11 TaxID=1200352 RepID=S4X9J7_9CORY|nr:hypothetical protein [Corynebacterium terpenotabidum]AGP29782.1 hypothetical protein A606_00635 [Corynebacterium terpenotabidum Y-11]
MSIHTTTPDVIILGHGLVADQIRRNLTDLASLGLIDPFTWVDPVLSETGTTVRRIGPDGQQVLSIDRALRAVGGVPLLIALDIEDDTTAGLDMASVDRWTGSIEARLSSSPARVRILLPRLPRGGRVPEPSQSWPTTVAIAPEDSEAPDSPLSPVQRAGDPTEVAKVAAPTLCGLTGLWASADSCALLDDSGHPISTGGAYKVRLARAYHRTIDASAVEDQLRRTATDISTRLPQPVTPDGRQADHMGAQDAVPEALAHRLLHQYHGSLATPMQPEATPGSTHKSGIQAMTAFLRDYFSKGLGTPASWYRAAKVSARSSFDKQVQNSLYGADSPVRIISNPAAGPAQDLNLERMAEAAERHRQQAAAHGLRVGEAPQLGDMWTAYRNVALTLVDGAERQQGALETPKDAFGNRKIVEQGWMSVPDVDDSFRGFHPLLGQQFGYSQEDAVVPPFDAVKAWDYEQKLNFVAGQTREPAIRQLQQQFTKWKETASRSFAWHTGHGLRLLIGESLDNLKFQVHRLDTNAAGLAQLQARDTSSLNRDYQVTTRVLLGLEFALLLAMVLSVVVHAMPSWQLTFFKGIPWHWAVLWFVLGTLIFMGIHMASYAKARRGVEAYLQQVHLLQRNLKITQDNVQQGMENLYRQLGAYQQLLSWSTLLGRAISRPLGRDTSTAVGLESPSSGLPLSTGIGQATIPDDDLGPLVNTVRQEIFPPHWAENAFNRLLADTTANREHLTGEHSPTMTQLAGQSGTGTGSGLDKLSRWAVGPEMDNRDHSRERWSEVVATPSIARQLSQRISTVEFFHDGRRTSTTTERFLSTLRGENPASGSFLQDAVSAIAVNEGATSMDAAVCRLDLSADRDDAPAAASGWGSAPVDAPGTLTRSATLVQFGQATELKYLGLDTGRDNLGHVPVDSPLPVFEPPTFDAPSSDAPTFIPPAFAPPTFDTPTFDTPTPGAAQPGHRSAPDQNPFGSPSGPASPASPDLPDWDSLI